MNKIHLISPQGSHPYSANEILSLLKLPQTAAGHGREFGGRPATGIIATADQFIKLRTEYRLGERASRQFVQLALQNESNAGLYHPQKCWFLIEEQATDASWTIGNIMPRLTPLDQHDADLATLSTLLEMYLKTALKLEKSLDLSLSNFAHDADGAIYYLDDDLYPWRDFNILCDFLSHLLRSGRLQEQHVASQLGSRLRTLLADYFEDPHWAVVIAESIRSAYVAPEHKQALTELWEALSDNSTVRRVVTPAAQRIALIADVHANLPALRAVLEKISHCEVQQILLLGDVVGYGPHPNECIELLTATENLYTICGNHDHSAINGVPAGGANNLASWSLEWTRTELNQASRQWLAALPPYLQTEDWLAVHGSPLDKTFFNAYVYQMSYVENLDVLQQRHIPLCFHGHTHIQKIFYRGQYEDGVSCEQQLSLTEYQHALICPGSVGQPRNQLPGAEFAIVDMTNRAMRFYRIDYDIKTTLADMKQKQFPQKMIERLSRGE